MQKSLDVWVFQRLYGQSFQAAKPAPPASLLVALLAGIAATLSRLARERVPAGLLGGLASSGATEKAGENRLDGIFRASLQRMVANLAD